MILRDAFALRTADTGRYLQTRRARSGSGWTDIWVWVEDPRFGGAWTEGHVDRWLARRDTLPREFDGRPLEKVRAPACGCCGDAPRDWVEFPDAPLNGAFIEKWGPVVVVEQVGADPEIWRCKKHIGRNPCIIVGCTKTFAHKGGSGYETDHICGRHWRMAPKPMRDKVSKIRRLAKRRGWNEKLARVHDILWERCIRVVRRGLEAPRMSDVEQSAGPPPPALAAELARLGL